MYTLEIKDLAKEYGKKIVLECINLSVAKGQVWAIIGEPKSGKSTLVSLILGLEKPSGGTILRNGTAQLQQNNNGIGALVEPSGFYPYLTVEQNLTVIRDIKKAATDEIVRVLDITGLIPCAARRTDKLSPGMKRRLAMAAALIGMPNILVLDDPFKELDREEQLIIRHVFREERAKETTVIFTCSLPEIAERVCTHTALLCDGKIRNSGKVSDLIRQKDRIVLSTDRVSMLFEELQRSGLILDIEQVDYEIILTPESGVTTADINRFSYEKGHILTKLAVMEANLSSAIIEMGTP